MDEETERLIADAKALYEPIVIGKDGRISNGNQLWQQFETVIELCAQGAEGCERQLLEKINELAAAKILVDDPNLHGAIAYEPDLLQSGRKIDFVVEREADNLYVEVKTVKPNALDNEKSWARYQELCKFHPDNVRFIVREDWMGGMIYGNTFSSRSKFLQYTLAFEQRLNEVQQVRAGPGLLVFCGTGFQWHVSDLEDFADFYHSGRHRADDPFALMEQHEIETRGIEMLGNISDFAFIKRNSLLANFQKIYFPVRGPAFGR